jgi:hypothetical protein
MPITRRKRANPPDQPENTNNLADQPENSPEQSPDQAASASPVETEHPVDSAPTAPARPESAPAQPAPTPAPILPPTQPALPPSLALAISERAERNERAERAERPEYTPIEGGRRTARGELFRRPPQPPPVAPPTAAAPVAPTLQPPSHEIKLPLGREQGDSHGDPLHLAYNPSYTGSEGARSALLQHLANESKAGGRARCWNCGSLAIVYDRWSTRSKTFGEVGIAFCEICGVWSVM